MTPVADGAVAVDVAGSVAIDAAGNYNIVAPQLSVTYDATGPTVALTTTSSVFSGLSFQNTHAFCPGLGHEQVSTGFHLSHMYRIALVPLHVLRLTLTHSLHQQ